MTFTRRYRLDALSNSIALLGEDDLRAVERHVAGLHANNDSPECDGSAAIPSFHHDANRTAPHTLADRGQTSAPFRQGDSVATSSEIHPGQTGLEALAETGRDTATVAASEASPEGRSAGDRFCAGCGIPNNGTWPHARDCTGFRCGQRVANRESGALGTVSFVTGLYGVQFITVDWDDGCTTRCEPHILVDAQRSGREPDDFNLDAATAEADCNALEAVTGPGGPGWAIGDEVLCDVGTMMWRKGRAVAWCEGGMVRVDVGAGRFVEVGVERVKRNG